MMKFVAISMVFLLLGSVTSQAAEFADGPLILGYGKHAPVQQDIKPAKDAVFKVVFDVSQRGKDGGLNRHFDSVARFLNMNVANGMAAENVQVAIVLHGSASYDILNAKAYKAKFGKENPNLALISQLLENKVDIVLCGQSSAFQGIGNEDMIEGVDMALSAMTAHAMYAAKGYSQNPF
jgi:intracellular sulfur oxidation DsrE/DsrF family protein